MYPSLTSARSLFAQGEELKENACNLDATEEERSIELVITDGNDGDRPRSGGEYAGAAGFGHHR